MIMKILRGIKYIFISLILITILWASYFFLYGNFHKLEVKELCVMYVQYIHGNNFGDGQVGDVG